MGYELGDMWTAVASGPERLRLAALLVAVFVVTAACGGSQAGTGTGNPIVIGAVVNLSGPISVYDLPTLNAFHMAVADINTSGGVLGRPLQLVTEDMHSSVADSRPAAADLLARGASLLITASDYDLGSPAAFAAQGRNVLALAAGCGSIQCGPPGGAPLWFTFGNAGRSEGAAMAEFASRSKQFRSAWTLRDSAALFHTETWKGFRDRFTELGGTVIGSETFAPTDTTIAPQISHLAAIGRAPDAIFLTSDTTGGVAAIRQLRAAGFQQPIMSTNSFDGSYWEQGVPGLSNFYYSNYASFYGDDPSSAINQFFSRYKAKYAQPQNSILITGYALIQAFKLAAAKAGSLAGDKLAAALESLPEMNLIVGPTTFTHELHIDLTRRLVIMTIHNGQPTSLQYWNLSKLPRLDD